MMKIFNGILFLFSISIFAQNGVPKAFNVQGTIYQPSSSNPFLGSSNIRFQILNQAATCVMYQEVVSSVDTTNTNGAFSVDLGTTATRINNIDSTTTLGLNIFKNNVTHPSITGCTGAITIAAAEKRKLRISFDVGSGFVDMTPDIDVLTAPYAMIAETLDGHTASEFIMANTSAGLQVSQSNIETLLNSITNFNTLNNFASTGNISGNAATATTASTVSNGAITANKLNQMGAATGQIMKWDGAAWVASNDLTGAGGTVTSVTASLPLSASVSSTPNITIATANTTSTGALSSTDWNTFNNKLSNFSTLTSNDISAALSFTPVGPTALNNYLPLAGGVLTGNLGIGAGIPTNLLSINSAANQGGIDIDAALYPEIQFKIGSVRKGWIAADVGGGMAPGTTSNSFVIRSENATHITNGNTIALTAVNGNVGIGTATPATKLEVNGEVKIGNSATACSGANEGAQRYNSSSKIMEFCNGTSWISFTAAVPVNPVGTVLPFAGSSTPLGYLPCDGSAVSRVTYADLFASIGTTFGIGDGSTTFNVPDLRGRVAMGDGQGSGLTNRTSGTSGGTELVNASVTTVVSVSSSTIGTDNSMTDLAFLSSTPGGGSGALIYLPTSTPPGTPLPLGGVSNITPGINGGDGTDANIQPYTVLKYIIKY